jgi:hypothetical protein
MPDGAAAAVLAMDRVADIGMVGQEEENWCWATVTQSLLAARGERLSQQDVATRHLQNTGRTYTCAPPNRLRTSTLSCRPGTCEASCNDMHSLEVVMREFGLLGLKLSDGDAPSPEVIKAEIAADRPIACGIKWKTDPKGHVCLVVGWSTGADGKMRVLVLDPAASAGGTSVSERPLTYPTFARNYPGASKLGKIDYSYQVI